MSRLIKCLAVAATLAASGAARAEEWPPRTLTMVVPYAAGGPTDAVGRLFAQYLGEALKAQVVVENIGGAGGMTGASRVAQSAPDGSHFLFGGSNMTYSQLLSKKPPFNSAADFAPVGMLTRQSLVLITRKDYPANDLRSFASSVKSNGNANFASAGAGSSTHLGCVMLNLAIDAKAAHVPYRGVSLAMQDLIAGRVDYICNLIQDAAPQIQGGAVKAIAMLSRSRSPLLPDLQTAQEQGLQDFDASDWYGLFMPKGTPAQIVQKLNAAAGAALQSPQLRDRLKSLGVEPIAADQFSPEYLARFLVQEIARWAVPIAASGAAEK